MRKFCLLLILSLALPVFCLLQAVEPPKKEIRAVWLTTVYGLDWPHKPATTEAGRKAEQQAFEALEPREQREIMRLVGKFSHVLNEECEAFKRQVAAENEADDKGEGETCDS